MTVGPAVVVMNPYYTGIGIARALHARAVRVIAVYADPRAPGRRSRYFDEMIEVPNVRSDPQRLVEALLAIGRRLGAGGDVEGSERPIIFPTSDADILFLHEHRATLKSVYRLPQPDAASPILVMMDKLTLADRAHAIGVATPTTIVCASEAALEQAMPSLRLPAILKPRFANQWRGAGNWKQVGEQKAFIALDADALRQHYRRVAAVHPEVLIQEFIPGVDADIVVYCCYIDQSGAVLGSFTGRKLRQDPPQVGTGCVVECVDVPEIAAPAVRILREFGYCGIAEVEFKRRGGQGEFSLIEINPRHWDQHEMGLLAGVNLSWIAYRKMCGGDLAPVLPRYDRSTPFKWIAEGELVRATLGELRGLSKSVQQRRTSTGQRGVGAAVDIIRSVSKLIHGRRILAVGRWADPLPAILLWGRFGGELVGRAKSALGFGRAADDAFKSAKSG